MKLTVKNLIFLAAFAISGIANAQKSIYIPAEWKSNKTWDGKDTLLYKETDTENKYTWSKTRSKESDNFICFWDKDYAKEPTTLGSSNTYYVNIDDLLSKAESFYKLNVGTLAFCDENNSNVKKYKMLILVNHTTDWVCYGSGYDNTIGALWLSPSTCKPVGHSVAHEVGHSFQYMCFVDNKGYSGFRNAIGNGSTFWEQTAQWQANQSYPELMFDQSWSVFSKSHNYATTHEWHRYQSYWWHYYLAEKHGIDVIGKIWRHQMSAIADPNEVYMDLMGYTAKDLYKEYFDYAMKMATLDLDVCRSKAEQYIGSYAYNYVTLGGTKHQVALSSCPQSTGFNIIPLKVPEAGTLVSTELVSLYAAAPLAEGDPATYLDGNSVYANATQVKYNNVSNYKNRGFRIGYVALLKDGKRVYLSEDSIYCTGVRASASYSGTVGCTVPENVSRLFLVVSPSPSAYYKHSWDESLDKDDMWPYTVEFTNTNILGCPTLSDDLPVTDATIEYDVYFPANSSDYAGTTVTIEGDAAATLGTAFQMQASRLNKYMQTWSSSAPSEGKAAFFALNSNGNIASSGSTANGYGHWFNSTGNVVGWGTSAYLFSEFDASALKFTVGQYPARLSNGKDYKIAQAIKYKKDGQVAVVKFLFNVHVTKDKTGYSLVKAENSPVVTGVASVSDETETECATYDLSGKVVKKHNASAFRGKALVDGQILINR